MGISVYYAMRPPLISATTERVVAKIIDARGDVQIRIGSAPLWLDSGSGQDLSADMRVATGAHSSTEIQFVDGQKVLLGAKSQITLGGANDQGSDDIIVHLIKGTLDSHAAPRQLLGLGRPKALVIQAGDSQIRLRSDADQARIAKVAGSATPEIRTIGGTALAMNPRTGVEQPIAPMTTQNAPVFGDIVAPAAVSQGPSTPARSRSPAEAPVTAVLDPNIGPAPTTGQVRASVPNTSTAGKDNRPATAEIKQTLPKSNPLARVTVPPIIDPPGNTTYWAVEPSVPGNPISVAVTIGTIANDIPGRVGVTVQNGGKYRTVAAQPVAQRKQYMAMVTLDDQKATSVRPTIIPTRDAGGSLPLKEVTPLKLALRSLAEFRGRGPLVVSLKSFAPQTAQGLIRQNGELKSKDANYRIYLPDSQLLPHLAPYLRGSQGFSITAGKPANSDSALHIVGHTGISATVVGPVSNPGRVDALIQSLGGELAFVGSAATHSAAMPSNLTADNLLVLKTDGKKVKVKSSLLRADPDARSLVAKEGRHFFTAVPSMIRSNGRDVADLAEAPAPMSIAAWRAKAHAAAHPRRFLFVQASPNDSPPRFLEFDAKTFNMLGGHYAVDGSEASLTYGINYGQAPLMSALGTTQTPEELVKFYMNLGRAYAVVFAPPKGQWQIITLANGQLKRLGSGVPPTSPTSAKDVHAWLGRVLAQDASVLAVQGSFALSTCPASGINKVIYGVIKNPQTVAEVVAFEAGFCILHTLFGKSAAVGSAIAYY